MTDKALHSMTNNTNVETTDEVYVLDDPTGTPADNRATVAELMKTINKFTEDTSPNSLTDYVMTYDASAFAVKKVLLKNVGSYTLPFSMSGSFNPATSKTYYVGGFISTPTETAQRRRIHIPYPGTIRRVYVDVSTVGTLGTSENNAFYVRLNDTADTTITTTAPFDAVNKVFSNTGLSVAVVAGDYLEIKLTTPSSYSTPPTAVQISGVVWVTI